MTADQIIAALRLGLPVYLKTRRKQLFKIEYHNGKFMGVRRLKPFTYSSLTHNQIIQHTNLPNNNFFIPDETQTTTYY